MYHLLNKVPIRYLIWHGNDEFEWPLHAVRIPGTGFDFLIQTRTFEDFILGPSIHFPHGHLVTRFVLLCQKTRERVSYEGIDGILGLHGCHGEDDTEGLL